MIPVHLQSLAPALERLFMCVQTSNLLNIKEVKKKRIDFKEENVL